MKIHIPPDGFLIIAQDYEVGFGRNSVEIASRKSRLYFWEFRRDRQTGPGMGVGEVETVQTSFPEFPQSTRTQEHRQLMFEILSEQYRITLSFGGLGEPQAGGREIENNTTED